MTMKLRSIGLCVAAVVMLATPVFVDGFCEEENQDYWCGYRCDVWQSGCYSDGSVSQNDACVWLSYQPGWCFTAENAPECSTSCEL